MYSYVLGVVDLDIEAVLRGDGLQSGLGTRGLGFREESSGRGRQHPWGAIEVHHLRGY